MYLADMQSLLNIEWDCIIVSDEYRRMWKEIGSCQCGNACSGCVRGGECSGSLKNIWLYKKDSSPLICLVGWLVGWLIITMGTDHGCLKSL